MRTNIDSRGLDLGNTLAVKVVGLSEQLNTGRQRS